MITGSGTPSVAGMSPAFAENLLELWTQAWNSHDPERLLALMTADVVYDDAAWPELMRGHADVRRFLDSIWTAIPDLRLELVDGPHLSRQRAAASFYWSATGTLTGPLDPPGFAPTGEPVEFEGAGLHEYRDGKIASLRIVFDGLDVARQLGLLPKPGSRAERAAVTAQRLGARARGRFQRG